MNKSRGSFPFPLSNLDLYRLLSFKRVLNPLVFLLLLLKTRYSRWNKSFLDTLAEQGLAIFCFLSASPSEQAALVKDICFLSEPMVVIRRHS